ncbi:AfsA-related hotdog domain-containing protein [Pseudomonas fluorescens]|uniref:AfsA-related hotdog domain-containing protein n=1 Tax=Pseudomonas fluorescens TaxID=294 RepID=UPI000F46AC56|nr:AfsA-related hotdog domain-containing protein [Pseudomonas fluorescens]RON90835.1 A-factor biosynthesis protein [Pseudomonas fluorescens]
MIDMHRKVAKDIVHKGHDDDVLIYDAHHLLPAWLPAAIVQRANLDPMDLEIVNQAYRLDSERLVLRSLPTIIDLEELELAGLSDCLPELLTNYEKTTDHLILSGVWVLESTEAKLARLPGCDNGLSLDQRRQVHEVLKNLDGCPQQGLLYFTLFNDTANYFFYRKHHEHVPGLMLIEAARQAMYAQFYEHSGYARGEVSISIVDLLSSFPRYTESSFQVDVLVGDYEGMAQPRARKVDKRARFFQRGELVADIRLHGEVIKMPVFKRMRNINIDPACWFRPLKGIRHEVLVRLDSGRHLSARLELLSMAGLQVQCDSPVEASERGHVYLYLENEGMLSLPLQSLHASDATKAGTLKLHLAELDSPLRFKWREVLKQFAYFSHEETAPAPAPVLGQPLWMTFDQASAMPEQRKEA